MQSRFWNWTAAPRAVDFCGVAFSARHLAFSPVCHVRAAVSQ